MTYRPNIKFVSPISPKADTQGIFDQTNSDTVARVFKKNYTIGASALDIRIRIPKANRPILSFYRSTRLSRPTEGGIPRNIDQFRFRFVLAGAGKQTLGLRLVFYCVNIRRTMDSLPLHGTECLFHCLVSVFLKLVVREWKLCHLTVTLGISYVVH